MAIYGVYFWSDDDAMAAVKGILNGQEKALKWYLSL